MTVALYGWWRRRLEQPGLRSQQQVHNALTTAPAPPSATAPFYQISWPVPNGPTYSIDLRGFLQSSFFDTSVLPFPNNDLPPPKGYVYPQDLRTFIQSAVRLYGVGVLPYNQTDWPVPKGYVQPYDNKTFVINGIPLLTAPLPPPPKTNYDYPNPLGYIYPQSLRIFNISTVGRYLGKDTFFGLAGTPNFDQPNPPRGYAYPQDLRTFIQTTQRNLIGKDNLPKLGSNAQANILNPLIAGRAFQNGTMQSLQSTLLPTGGSTNTNQLMMMGVGT